MDNVWNKFGGMNAFTLVSFIPIVRYKPWKFTNSNLT